MSGQTLGKVLEYFVKQLTALLKKLRLGKLLTIFLAGIALFVSTACSNGDLSSARPEKPSVQAGQQQYQKEQKPQLKLPTEPEVKTQNAKGNGDQANLDLTSQQLIAANNESELLYPGAETTAGRAKKEQELRKITDENAVDPIPASNQAMSDHSDSDANILKRAGNMFKEASGFIKDKADEAGDRPEMKVNPAVQK